MKKRRYLLCRLLRILVMSSSHGVSGAEAPIDITFNIFTCTLLNRVHVFFNYIDLCSLFLSKSNNDY